MKKLLIAGVMVLSLCAMRDPPKNWADEPVYMSYGMMLCKDKADLAGLYTYHDSRLPYKSCKPSHGGWGRTTSFPGVGWETKLYSGESGWSGTVDVLLTCWRYQYENERSPDPLPPVPGCK